MFFTSEVYRDSISRLASFALTAFGRVLDGEEDELGLVVLAADAAGVQQHELPPDGRENVVNLEVVERRVLGQDFLQQLPQPGDVPLLVAQVVNELAHRFFRRDPEGPVEGAVRLPHPQVGAEDQ